MGGNKVKRSIDLSMLPLEPKGNRISWINSIGCVIPFEYDDIISEFIILKYNKTKQSCVIQYNNKEYNIKTYSLTRCEVGVIVKKRLVNIYKFNIGEIINTNTGSIKIIEQLSLKSTNTNAKGYKYICLIDGYIGTIFESNLSKGEGCTICAGKKVLKNINDMWTTNPDLAKLLANPDDGYKYTQSSKRRVNWKCPECGNIIENKTICDIKRRGLFCPKCSDGISYPEKFIYNLLSQLKLTFETQKYYKWSNLKHYDFYLNDFNCIIEVNGIQHYTNKNTFNIRDERSNDIHKINMAINNGITNYIIIDARESDFTYLKNSIINNYEINKILNLDNINWELCHYNSLKSLIMIACQYWNNGIKNTLEISEIMELSQSTIIRYLQKCADIGLCDYSSENTKNTTAMIEKRKRSVICITTGEIFKSIVEAQRYYKVYSISSCCRGERRYAGKLPDGTKLKWEYADAS